MVVPNTGGGWDANRRGSKVEFTTATLKNNKISAVKASKSSREENKQSNAKDASRIAE